MGHAPANDEPAGASGQPTGGAAAGAPPSSATAQQGQQHAGGSGGVAAAQPPPPPQELPEGGSPLLPEPLLPGSSEDEEAAAAGDQPQAALSAEEAAQRKRRREQWEREQEGKQRWDLARRLSDISTDVEFLAREVERVRSEMEVPLPSLSDLPEGERLQLEAMRRRRLTDLLANHCKKTLGHITSHKWSWPFQAPVDTNQYPDYALAITKPMDFGTIKRKIDAGISGGGYRHPDEFLSDVRLVFDNARLYNKPGSDVHVMANTLQERFEERYSAGVAPRVLEESAVTVAQREEVRRRHQEAQGKDRSGEALEQHCAVLIKYIDEVTACILDARSAAAALCKPVSREEKEALVRALTAMPQEQFEAAMGLVLAHHPGLQACDDFGFDLDALDALSLRQMQSFVRACEAAEAEAKQLGRPGPGASVGWPQLLLGAGLRPYRPPRGSKRLRRQSGGGVATPAAVSGLQQQQQQQRRQQEVMVKQEPQVHAWQQPPPAQLPGQPQQPAGGIRTGKGSRRPMSELVADIGHLPSTLTPEEVAAAAAAAVGMLAPMLPSAGSAVAPKLLGLPAGAGAGAATPPAPPPSLPAPAAASQRQQQAAAAARKQGAAAVVGSNKPIPPLGLPTAGPAPAAAKEGPGGTPVPVLGPLPTPAQMAAVASATAEQHHFLSQMHGLLSQAHKTQTAAAQEGGAAKPSAQKQQQQQQPKS